ncbi:hypothetical protein C500_03939 [Natrialba magadii ATCC 43099]|nr:hypothetical protein [Natrialba magadii]ELY32411.1 hypothetical protein C500_03939 [Natrialba magadii ATCC 43099]
MGTSMITTTTTEPIRADHKGTESDDSDRSAAETNAESKAESNHYSSEAPR